MKATGSRAEVWHKNARKTRGGLKRDDLFMKNGRIKSKRASRRAKRTNQLKKSGWTYKKGQFGAVKVEKKSKGRRGKGRGTKRR